MFDLILAALKAHKARVITVGAVGFAAISAFLFIPFENNWWIFFVKFLPLAAALGFFLAKAPGKSSGEFWKKGGKFLKFAVAAIIVFAFLAPQTGKVVWKFARGLDGNIAAATEGNLALPSVGKTTSTITKRIPIKENVWSEWVEIPIGLDFQVNDTAGSGHIEVKFLDGRIISDLEDGKPAPKWQGVVRNCSFRIRRISGEGTAVVTMTRS